MRVNPKMNNIIKSLNLETGFSLIEVCVALVVLLIVVLGAFTALSFAINYNFANNTRSKALAVLQKEEEELRSVKFSATVIDTKLLGGEKPIKTVVLDDGDRFQVDIKIDDDPFTTGIQIDGTMTLKEIEISVAALDPTQGWQTAVPVRATFRRVRMN